MSFPLSSESLLIAEAIVESLMEVFPLLMKKKQLQSRQRTRGCIESQGGQTEG